MGAGISLTCDYSIGECGDVSARRRHWRVCDDDWRLRQRTLSQLARQFPVHLSTRISLQRWANDLRRYCAYSLSLVNISLHYSEFLEVHLELSNGPKSDVTQPSLTRVSDAPWRDVRHALSHLWLWRASLPLAKTRVWRASKTQMWHRMQQMLPLSPQREAQKRKVTVFSERELQFMFAICHRPSVCLSSVVCL